jgi:hypothetical protein
LSALLSGCGSGGDMADNPPGVSALQQFGSLELTATTAQTRYAPGAQIPLTLAVKNVGAQTAQITVTGCYLSLDVIQRGQRIGPPVTGCPDSTHLYSIAPGTTQNFNVSWDQTDSQGNRVPFGQYGLVLRFGPSAIDGMPITPQEVQTRLSTDPILVSIQGQ